MSELTSICVFCGASAGFSPAFEEAAIQLGEAIATAGLELIYGGGSVGLMGAVSNACLGKGGRVVGIIPQFLHEREVIRRDLSELIITDGMHERKQLMFQRADAFVALPGGIGTLEELVEQMTWAQLGRHQKPIAVANIENFWSPLSDLISHMRGLNFIRPDLDIQYQTIDTVSEIIPALQTRFAELQAGDLHMSGASVEQF